VKCYHPTCSTPHNAEFVKLESDEESCGQHLPDGCEKLLSGDVNTAQGWTHVDCAWKCCACGIYYGDGEARIHCANCGEPACYDCIDYSNVCAGCRDRDAERSDVLDVIRRA
jgi:hypothetical protein